MLPLTPCHFPQFLVTLFSLPFAVFYSLYAGSGAMAGIPQRSPSVKFEKLVDVFMNFRRRRTGIIKALTIEYDIFFQKCDPDGKELCLSGLPTGTWKVYFPDEEAPPDLPEPTVGINKARDGTQKGIWVRLISIHSDSWLISFAFFLAANFDFNKEERKKLFGMINELPTIYEVVNDYWTDQEEKAKKINGSSLEHQQQQQEQQQQQQQQQPQQQQQQQEEEVRVDEDDNCGACGRKETLDGFWVCCDVCQRWYHCGCVDMSPAMAEEIPYFVCPRCKWYEDGGGSEMNPKQDSNGS